MFTRNGKTVVQYLCLLQQRPVMISDRSNFYIVEINYDFTDLYFTGSF